jgi:hypothetical protein
MTDGQRILLAALICTTLGLGLVYVQGWPNATMNFWGVVSFGAIGASLGCLTATDDGHGPFDLWGGWW